MGIVESSACIDVTRKKISKKKTMSTIAVMSIISSTSSFLYGGTSDDSRPAAARPRRGTDRGLGDQMTSGAGFSVSVWAGGGCSNTEGSAKASSEPAGSKAAASGTADSGTTSSGTTSSGATNSGTANSGTVGSSTARTG